jgi:predicted dehydrogenase
VKSYTDYRSLLESRDIDAVVIATPDHWHSRMTVDAASAQKDIYVEKGMTRTVAEAKAMVDAVKRNKRILQLGHQRTSSPVTFKAKELCESGQVGHVSLIRLSRFRNSIRGEWNYRIDPEAGPETIDWNRFLGDAPRRAFDPDRYFRWRRYWDYGTGISGDLLSHEWSAANVFLKLGIPRTCIASGGVYFWEDGREVPDVLNVLYEYPDRDLSLTFSSTFSNSRRGTESESIVFGRNATLVLTGDLTMYLEPNGAQNQALIERARQDRRKAGLNVGEKEPVPVLTFTRQEGQLSSHMQNFFDCVRSRERTRCNEDDGFDEAVTLVMSVISYREMRMVTWDPRKQEIV